MCGTELCTTNDERCRLCHLALTGKATSFICKVDVRTGEEHITDISCAPGYASYGTDCVGMPLMIASVLDING
jgi:hypothetical protein